MKQLGIVMCGGLLAFPCLARAQSPLLPHDRASAAWIQAQRPRFEMAVPAAVLLDAGLRLPFGKTTELELSLPLVYITGDVMAPYSKGYVGNPSLGLRSADSTSRYGFALRLPLGQDRYESFYGRGIGGTAEPDHIEGYMPELLTVTIALERDVVRPSGRGAVVTVLGGVSAFFPTTEGSTEAMANYGMLARAPLTRLDVGLGLTGRMLLTQAGGMNLGDRTFHQLHAAVSLPGARISPTLFARVPLDDSLEELDYVIGAAAVIRLR